MKSVAKLELGERQTIINANLLTSVLSVLWAIASGKREQKEGFISRFLRGHKIAKNKSHWWFQAASAPQPHRRRAAKRRRKKWGREQQSASRGLKWALNSEFKTYCRSKGQTKWVFSIACCYLPLPIACFLSAVYRRPRAGAGSGPFQFPKCMDSFLLW